MTDTKTPDTTLPAGWADWGACEKRLGTRFIEWAEPPPSSPDQDRYAVVIESGLVRWACCSPNPTTSIEYSAGAFYDDEHGSAVDAAAENARRLRAARLAVLAEHEKDAANVRERRAAYDAMSPEERRDDDNAVRFGTWLADVTRLEVAKIAPKDGEIVFLNFRSGVSAGAMRTLRRYLMETFAPKGVTILAFQCDGGIDLATISREELRRAMDPAETETPDPGALT